MIQKYGGHGAGIYTPPTRKLAVFRHHHFEGTDYLENFFGGGFPAQSRECQSFECVAVFTGRIMGPAFLVAGAFFAPTLVLAAFLASGFFFSGFFAMGMGRYPR
jgi:hypothetical protein